MSSLYTYVASGVYMQEEDYTGRARIFNSSTGGIVFEADRGPVEPLPFLTTSGDEWVRAYGKANPAVSRAHTCALTFHDQSSVLYNKRVTNGALYAGGMYIEDKTSKAAGGKTRVIYQPFPFGMTGGYKEGYNPVTLLTFADLLVDENEVTVDITDGATTQNASVTFADSHNATLAALATAITAALATFGNGGFARVVDEGGPLVDQFAILIFSPINSTVLVEDAAVAEGATQTTVTLDDDAVVLVLFADNPGKWGSDLGTKIVGFDPGIFQRHAIEFSGPFRTGNSVQLTVNNTVIGPIAFDTDSDTTLAKLATAIAAHADVQSATVVEVPGALDNDRVINVIAKKSGPDQVTLSTPITTGGTAQPTAYVRETLKGIASTGEFQINVYERSNVRIPAERTHTVSMRKQINSRGSQTGIDIKLNNRSTGSDRVRVIIPETKRDFVWPTEFYEGGYVVDKVIRWMNGGDNGMAVLNSQIANGWESFVDRVRIPSRLLINGGYATPVVHQKMVEVAERRFDAMAILDMPADKQETQAAQLYRLDEINIDSSFGAIYSPDLLVPMDDTDEQVWVPPSGHVAAAYAWSERNSTIFHAPAGLVRGKLRRVLELAVAYNPGDREILEPIGVNPIIDHPGAGPCIYGEETLQYRKSILSSVHARRLLNLIKVSYADEADYTTFDPNNANHRFRLKQIGERLCKPYKDAGGLYHYDILSDERNNTFEVINEETTLVWIELQITPASKKIILKSILTPVGSVGFLETMEA